MRSLSIILCAAMTAGFGWLAMELHAGYYPAPYLTVPVKQSYQATPLAHSLDERPIAVLVHKENPTADITLGELARIYRGEIIEWPDGMPITAINRPIQSEVRERFYRIVLRAEATRKFFQEGTPFPFETVRVDAETAIAKFVSRDKSAIAYCYSPCAGAGIKVLRIEGTAPGDDNYALK